MYDQTIYSDLKQYKQIRQRNNGKILRQDVCWTIIYQKPLETNIKCFNRQKELDADPKASQQKDFIGQLNQLNSNGNATDVCVDQNMSVLVILEKIKEARLNFLKEV